MNGQTSASSKPTASVKSDRQADPFQDLRWISSALGAFSAVALLLTWWYGYVLTGWRFQPQVLWAIAIWSAGGGVGFLFAIPRVLQGAPPAGASATASTTTPRLPQQWQRPRR